MTASLPVRLWAWLRRGDASSLPQSDAAAPNLASSHATRLSLGVMLLAALACGLLLVAGALYAPRSLRATSKWVQHTYQVLSETDGFLLDVEMLASNQRAFLLTGDADYLSLYTKARAEAQRRLAVLRELTSDNPSQRERLGDLATVVTATLTELDHTIALAKAGSVEQALQTAREMSDQKLMQRLRSIGSAVIAEEDGLLAKRRENYARVQSRVGIGYQVACGTALLLLLAATAVAAYAILRDVAVAENMRVLALEAQRRTALIEAAYGTARIGLCLLDRGLRYIEVNDYMAGLHGLPASEHLGKSLDALFPDFAPAFKPLLQDVLDTGKPCDGLEVSISGLGRESGKRDWLVSLQPIRDLEGVVVGVGKAVLDITHRKRTEEELQKINEKLEEAVEARTAELVASEARLRAYWLYSPDTLFIVRVDPDGGPVLFEDANPALEAMSGLTPEQIRGRTPSELFSPDVADTLTAHYRRCANSGQLVRYNITLKGTKGPYDAETVLVPLPGTDGRIAQILGSERDVTDRNKLQAQLARAQKLEAVGQLTGGVAHDFNNLLTVVMSNAAFLRRKAEAGGDWQASRQAEMIEGAAERGGRLANQLLSFSRKQILHPESVLATDLLNGLRALFERAAGETIRFDVRSEDGLWFCHVDPTQLESAVLNLVINARDAMPHQGGHIMVEACNALLGADKAAALSVPPGEYVCISVADTGRGMTPEVLSRAIEPFFTTKEIGKGSGLGLAQVHGFAGQSGGAISIDSEVGRGTNISVFLPRNGMKVAQQAGGHSQPISEALPGTGQTVLVVEDEEDLRESVRFSLREIGYRVLEAPDAHTARRHLYSDEPIDLLFTDVVLPGGISGIELAREARRLRQDIRLMLTSGYADKLPGRQGSEAGEFEVLAKPYKPDRLVSRVQAVLTAAVP